MAGCGPSTSDSESNADSSTAEQHEPYDLSITAGTNGGQLSRWTLAAVDLINKHSDFINASAILTSSSYENIDLIANGEVEMGVADGAALSSGFVNGRLNSSFRSFTRGQGFYAFF